MITPDTALILSAYCTEEFAHPNSPFGASLTALHSVSVQPGWENVLVCLDTGLPGGEQAVVCSVDIYDMAEDGIKLAMDTAPESTTYAGDGCYEAALLGFAARILQHVEQSLPSRQSRRPICRPE